jgi:hypothetical protein
MNTYKISVPGHFAQDWSTSSEGYAADIEKGSINPATAQAYMELFKALTETPARTHGRGTRHVIELSEQGVQFLAAEAKYCYEYNAPASSNPYGCEDPDPVARYAASRVMKACKKALAS